ncbi:3-hydroxymyristoyl/3-hydroxydecanoyl-(acyl carrier protein) dehydratase [Enterobacteriaceae bacterium strain FGI 57]|jgi:3-hydroxymyristoyl/3-hydroxydecanoyl-(acyl carrier protein) dehydratases|nr:3-hydroxymyristoyl/3-hydroxydecanoyl-(acyl carrier protein) dehydratase [Enterobacteriaceae bacterium strain FGI 57]
MTMTPDEISCQHTGAGEAEIVLHLPATLFWFKGHFAVQPLLPGVAQLEWVMHYASRLLTPDYRFHSIQNVKFQAPLLPENRVTLTLTWLEARQVLAFRYQRHDGDARHTTSSGKIRLCR